MIIVKFLAKVMWNCDGLPEDGTTIGVEAEQTCKHCNVTT